MMSPGMPPHGIPRPDGSMMKNQNLPGMEAITRYKLTLSNFHIKYYNKTKLLLDLEYGKIVELPTKTLSNI